MEIIGDVIEFIIKFPFIVVGWIIVGMIAGELARRFTNSADKNGFSDFILGIFGAVIGGFVAGLLGVNGPMGGLALVVFNLLIATVGAIIIIFAWRAVTGKNEIVAG
ncbi:MAG: GlsB/YeaQ/YmgE family stress response membrane protein [Chloroflexota bacterium]